jgi:OOP family OmpA-OmpF porin
MQAKYIKVVGAGLLAILSVSNVTAGNRTGATTLTLATAYYHFDYKRHLNNESMPNVALAYNFSDQWAMEGGIGVVNTHQTAPLGRASVRGYLYTVDTIYRFLPQQRLEPYISFGVGMLSMKPNGLDATNQGNINAGIGTQIFFTDSIALRGEVRDLYTTTGAGKNDYMLNFGLSFLMGGTTAT